MNWHDYPNFTEAEFACKHSGKCAMVPEFMARLQKLRGVYGKPMTITSGYRHPTHPIEAAKLSPGAHATGRAADIAVQGVDAMRLLHLALQCGFTGIGVQQKGGGRFIHLDDISNGYLPRPAIWTY
jgi:uncharacterized protein YcbK (DUF882 family)